MGSLYRRKKGGVELPTWWIKYYADGRPIRESTGTDDEREARRILKAREGRVALGSVVLPRVDRIRYEEAAADLRAHYEATGTRDLAEYAYRVKHLDRFFGGRRISTIGQADVDRYVAHRQGQGAAPATIRRELGTLTKMLRLAYKSRKLLHLPIFDKPAEGPPRAGFFEREQYEAVRRHLPPDLQAALAIAYTFGWRMQSEILTLERRHLDLDAGTLRLDPGMTKNGEGRVAYLTPELSALLAEQVARVEALQKRLGRIVPWLFPYLTGPTRAGQRRRDFRKAWAKACAAAGIPGRYRHDLRRTAVRNMERNGVPRSVAMKLTGHKTENVYRRYAIVSDADLREAARRLSNGASGHTDGHTAPAPIALRAVTP